MDSRLDPVDLERRMRYNKCLNTMELSMPKSKIQFRKGQSLPEFQESYGADQQCEYALLQALWPDGFQCPASGYEKYCQLRSRKVLQCIRCKHQASLTAGTLFNSTKLPLSTWHLAMYLVTAPPPPSRIPRQESILGRGSSSLQSPAERPPRVS